MGHTVTRYVLGEMRQRATRVMDVATTHSAPTSIAATSISLFPRSANVEEHQSVPQPPSLASPLAALLPLAPEQRMALQQPWPCLCRRSAWPWAARLRWARPETYAREDRAASALGRSLAIPTTSTAMDGQPAGAAAVPLLLWLRGHGQGLAAPSLDCTNRRPGWS